MPPPANRRKLRKREILLAVTAGALAAGAAAAIMSDGFGGPGSSFDPAAAAGTAEERTYALAPFERISTSGPQDIEIKYGETQSVRAEGASGAIAELQVTVEDGELVIRPRNGSGWDFGGFDATKLYVTVPRLTRVALNGSGEVSVDGVKGERFSGVITGFPGELEISGLEVDEAEFTINGAGDMTVAGTARATRVTINGVGEVQAGELQSQTAVIAVSGPGDVELAVQEEAEVTVNGPGEVDIDGPARCSVTTSGPGSVSCSGPDTD